MNVAFCERGRGCCPCQMSSVLTCAKTLSCQLHMCEAGATGGQCREGRQCKTLGGVGWTDGQTDRQTDRRMNTLMIGRCLAGSECNGGRNGFPLYSWTDQMDRWTNTWLFEYPVLALEQMCAGVPDWGGSILDGRTDKRTDKHPSDLAWRE